MYCTRNVVTFGKTDSHCIQPKFDRSLGILCGIICNIGPFYKRHDITSNLGSSAVSSIPQITKSTGLITYLYVCVCEDIFSSWWPAVANRWFTSVLLAPCSGNLPPIRIPRLISWKKGRNEVEKRRWWAGRVQCSAKCGMILASTRNFAYSWMICVAAFFGYSVSGIIGHRLLTNPLYWCGRLQVGTQKAGSSHTKVSN